MIYTIENDFLRVEINSLGAELHSIYDKRTCSERLWQASPELWPRRAPIIFPLTGKAKNETYTFDGKKYRLPLHGFARDLEHSLVELNENSIRLRLEDCDTTKEMYPFNFCFDSVIALQDNTLIHRFEIVNNSSVPMPFSTGFHTGYMCPFDEEHSIEDYSIVFEKKETSQRTVTEVGTLLIKGYEDYLVDSNEIALHDKLFNPNLCFEKLCSERLKLLERDSGRNIELEFSGFPTMVLWSAKDKVRFLCIEPWHGSFEPVEDYGELSERPGIINLSPLESFSCQTRATFNNG